MREHLFKIENSGCMGRLSSGFITAQDLNNLQTVLAQYHEALDLIESIQIILEPALIQQTQS